MNKFGNYRLTRLNSVERVWKSYGANEKGVMRLFVFFLFLSFLLTQFKLFQGYFISLGVLQSINSIINDKDYQE